MGHIGRFEEDSAFVEQGAAWVELEYVVEGSVAFKQAGRLEYLWGSMPKKWVIRLENSGSFAAA